MYLYVFVCEYVYVWVWVEARKGGYIPGAGILGWCKLLNGVAKSQTWVPWKSRP